MKEATPRRPERLLESALLITLVCHALGMLSMAALLLPMIPGGGTVSGAARAQLVAAHPLQFRLGWVPWHLTAASYLLLAVGLLRAPRIPRVPAWIALGLTLVSVAFDQGGQALWLTRGMELAHRAAADPSQVAAYLECEAYSMRLTAAWAALGYSLTALAWTWCFAASGAWSRALTILSVPLWSIFLAVSVAPLVPALRSFTGLVALGNGVGFVLMEVWLLLVAERVLRWVRPETPHGRWARWRHPRAGAVGDVLSVVANSRWVRSIGELLAVPELVSDITDVIYVNYLVPIDRLAPFVPEGLELQRLGGDQRYAMFTFLTYRHGRFGPSILGIRSLFPRAIQSNWRAYVRDTRTGVLGTYFVTNAVTTSVHALAARAMADGAPMHVLGQAELTRSPEGELTMRLDPGHGTAPDANAALRTSPRPLLDSPWSDCFASYEELLRYSVPQDRALTTRPWDRQTVRDEIDLGIPLDSVEPLVGTVDSAAARAIVADARPLCFRVPKVSFRMSGEEADDW